MAPTHQRHLNDLAPALSKVLTRIERVRDVTSVTREAR